MNIKKKMTAALAFVLLGLTAPAWSAMTVTEMQQLLASDPNSFDEFGYSVAIDGDTALIGAPYDDTEKIRDHGSAYVFTRASGVWTQQAKLLPPKWKDARDDWFGYSVALDGDTAVIGAWGDDDNGRGSGSVSVFVRSEGVWTYQQKLLAADGMSDDRFGRFISFDGNTILVGAPLDDTDMVINHGSAYVFTYSGGMWTQQAKLVAADYDSGDIFGTSVSITGANAVVGAPRDGDNGFYSGSAYVFTGAGSSWSQTDKLLASDGQSTEQFGRAVAVDGNTIVVGSPWGSFNQPLSGAAYVYSDMGTGWTEQAKLGSSDGASKDHFGIAVDVQGNTAVIGASDHTKAREGAGYVFSRAGATWNETAKLVVAKPQKLMLLGSSVALDGSTFLLGAPRFDHNKRTDPGAAYVYVLDTEPPVVFDVVANPNPVPLFTPIILTATVDDTATGNSVITSAAVTIDGGAPINMKPIDGAFDQSVEDVTHKMKSFPEAGVHEICVSGTDAAGNTSDPQCILLAVYDPEAGFVTGGGWIDSPAGACQLTDDCVATSGKANFGFVSKYKKGANIPTGNTQFQFKAGDLNFHSDSYEWLVVAGPKAMYKGVGTINGAGNYGFMLTVIDEALTPSTDVDLFRIKIWNKDNGDGVVYDNKPGSGDNTDPTTAIGGGSIVIHKK